MVEHAKIVRAELKKKYPAHKFQVRVDHFSGGNAVRVYHIGEIDWDLDKEFDKFIDQFDGYASDLMDGMYNVGFMHNGERIRGASFCTYHHWVRKK